MAGQARDLPMIAGCESPLIITARACPVPLRPTGAGPYYPWAVFYRTSIFQEKGYEPAKTWDQFIALCKQMKADGLTPLAFADKDGWSAMGTFAF
jgi:hypothetical protein